ncbi:MAG: hypothetical protein CL533_18560 [Afipia sp.]|nr:hypothetical protein [Afipia sp.]OUX59666.1 MAG: hypothetical protein CBB64_18515 [Afipia sp. TMED4]HAO39978.1 hypothetical protein [Afipia sp.]HBF55038.1 hypothetical protein [Afipia sp.]HCX18136.1 hypothetical protein [Afipia sp.]|tara:strand:- start:312 stop:1745 length:1434 start_codon:yes stop_codon:yes gene_type:complete
MPRISDHFKLDKTQAELDFVNINTNKDTRLYVDPYAIEIRDDELSDELKFHITTFFEDVLKSLRKGDATRAQYLTENLHEPRETFLGVSKGKPRGRGVGREQADKMLSKLTSSRAYKTGLLTDLAETGLFIKNMHRDKISDLTTNLIRGPLIRYTQEQCNLLEIPLTNDVAVAPCWNPDHRRWDSGYHNLPLIKGKPIIFVPKVIVRRALSLEGPEFYNHHMLTFLQAEHLAAGTGLVKILKNGTRVVPKKSLKKVHPYSKDSIADFIYDNKHVLDLYKNAKGTKGSLSNTDFDEEYRPEDFCDYLARELAKIPSGKNDADKYHKFMTGVLTFLFSPHLISPKVEQPLHDGRKRIDIVYTNWSTDGFFSAIKTAEQTRARFVIVECKNYSEDIKNPEFDQLTGRFGHSRGRFGIICCRKNSNKATILSRSKDAALDGRGVVIVLDDTDILKLLTAIKTGNRRGVSVYLDQRYKEIAF